MASSKTQTLLEAVARTMTTPSIMQSIHTVNQAPELMNLGYLEADIGFAVHFGGAATASEPDQIVPRGRGIVLAALIEHPTEGLILFEAGCGPGYKAELDKAIAKTDHDIKDVKAVIMVHLHIDHAGGLVHFKDTDIPIWVLAALRITSFDIHTDPLEGGYVSDQLHHRLNWKPFHSNFIEFAPGINLHHAPGHIPGLAMMQLNLPKTGSWLFTTNQHHISANYEHDMPQGWASGDQVEWYRSHQKVKMLVKNLGIKLVFGHDAQQFETFKQVPDFMNEPDSGVV